MGEIDIPSYFLCPISLEIMKDPVILSTGITYDRESIENWMFSSKKDTCPVTRQVLLDTSLTPNHTLRRLIQAWCTLNASQGVQRIPTPKPPVDQAQILMLINNATTPGSQIKTLRRLKSIAAKNDRNKKCIESAGGVEFLASIIRNSCSSCNMEDGFDRRKSCDEALRILYGLQISEASYRTLTGKNGEFIETLMQVLRHGNYQSRAYAVMIMSPMLEAIDPIMLISLKKETVVEIVDVLHDQISDKAFKAALHILLEICPWGHNKVNIINAGAVPVLVELLLENTNRQMNEMMLAVLEQLCGCAEGRAELLSHSAGVAIVSKKILRVSQVASDIAVRILSSISRFSATPSVVQEMLQVGVVAKLCLVLQVNCGIKAKEKAKEMLRLHSKAWKNSSCIPFHLQSSYPS